MTQKYYSLDKINSKKATYNLIIGERSNGKTYAAMHQSLSEFVKTGAQFAYVRRWQEDVSGRRASMVFAGHNANNVLSELSGGKWDYIHYYSGKFYAAKLDEAGKPIYSDSDVMGYTFSLTTGEHNKSTSYPLVRTIVFDEFLTSSSYLPEEFVLFMNTVSTIVRRRDDVKIYMLANTVSKFAPYFSEMGLNNVQKMQQGTIDVYKYGESKLTVAVEYCESTTSKNKKAEGSDHYFAFNNPKLEMITGGAWELNLYPHLPCKYKPKEVVLTYFIEFFDNIFQCEVISVDNFTFTYIHQKTTPIKNPEEDLIYCLESHVGMNYNRSVYKPVSRVQEKILWFFRNDRVYYQNNEVGDTIHNYLKECKRV